MQENGETIPGVILAPGSFDALPDEPAADEPAKDEPAAGEPVAVQQAPPASGNRTIDELLRYADAMTMTR